MTTQSDPRAAAVRTVPVPGGDLAYEVLDGDTRPVLAVHGISSHRRLWSWLHAAAPELTLVTPTCAVAPTASTSPAPGASPGRVRLSGDALAGDATDILFGESRWQQVSQPIRFLRTEWSVGRGTPPAYAAADLECYAPVTERTVALDGVDHAASIMSPRGAAATAELVTEALA